MQPVRVAAVVCAVAVIGLGLCMRGRPADLYEKIAPDGKSRAVVRVVQSGYGSTLADAEIGIGSNSAGEGRVDYHWATVGRSIMGVWIGWAPKGTQKSVLLCSCDSISTIDRYSLLDVIDRPPSLAVDFTDPDAELYSSIRTFFRSHRRFPEGESDAQVAEWYCSSGQAIWRGQFKDPEQRVFVMPPPARQ